MRNGRRWTAVAAAVAASVVLLVAPGVGARGVAPDPQAPAADAKISVTAEGFTPSNLVIRRGVASRITFVRKVADTCATEVAVGELGIRVSLPLNEPVSVVVTPKTAGQYDYGCGNGVFHGTIMVR